MGLLLGIGRGTSTTVCSMGIDLVLGLRGNVFEPEGSVRNLASTGRGDVRPVKH